MYYILSYAHVTCIYNYIYIVIYAKAEKKGFMALGTHSTLSTKINPIDVTF